ncbi:hypothetical protein P167DRAFT_579793 [Morchella conica CCBAS932]|uniref:Uncharacterized protein n=1 Tax=Morchella conica CCBAS932 TaxID=1392247 RepID=A0A3N4KC85_9PEZI|nr:hypothetical protein P167DRAFT_579793 [Morchella conica CCBAS932]
MRTHPSSHPLLNPVGAPECHTQTTSPSRLPLSTLYCHSVNSMEKVTTVKPTNRLRLTLTILNSLLPDKRTPRLPYLNTPLSLSHSIFLSASLTVKRVNDDATTAPDESPRIGDT